MILYRAVIVRGMPDVAAATALRLPVTLLSAPGAALFAGGGWWRALVAAAHARCPGLPLSDVLDCADRTGHALEALRLGQAIVALAPGAAGRSAVEAAAASCGARLLAAPPPALDLDLRGSARLLEAWLRDGAPRSDGPRGSTRKGDTAPRLG